jgi:hypothetical protein
MLSILFLVLPKDQAFSSNNKVTAVRTEETVIIDGILDENVWKNEYDITCFIQRDPVEGSQPSENTIVRLVYDKHALYVGAKLSDSIPDSIVTRLGRRDAEMKSDCFLFYIDSYYDRRSGFYFGVNAGGTQYDGTLFNDEGMDDSWDGVWEGKASLNNHGWAVEMRIPFSQLRFPKKEKYIWGVNFKREIQRKNENDYLVYTPKNSSGFVSRFVDLVGIEHIYFPKRFELLPYIRNKAEFNKPDPDNPFHDGSKYTPDFGLDIKYGLGSNLTLDVTINPDFGQVEVDPAVVNLSDVETYFQEKRPFFIEGASIFDFGHGGNRSFWCFNWLEPTFFYSRRIGRAPQGSTPDHDFSDVSEGTHILGASKLCGKLSKNWNVGTIHAVTKRERGAFSDSSGQFHTELEPLTYYGVLRAQKEINNSRQGLGMISTISLRRFKEQQLRNDINNSAFVFGLDGWTFLDTSKTWVISGWTGVSHIGGTRERLINLQTDSRHYFQRPDVDHVKVDSTATSLTGYAARMWLNKQKGNWIFNSGFGFISPEFELNDMGFLGCSDLINYHIGGGYQWTELHSWMRSVLLIGTLFQSYDFSWNTTMRGMWYMADIELRDYTFIKAILGYYPQGVDNRKTRGGPLTVRPSILETDFFIRTDTRKSWIFNFGTYGLNKDKNTWWRVVQAGVEWKPKSNVSIQFNPEIMWNHEFAQWIDSFEDPEAVNTFGNRYVFAEMKQKQLSANIRLNWTFTQKLSLQIYMQPLISHGRYSHFKELARPGSYDFNNYRKEQIILNDGEYKINPDGSEHTNVICFEDPNFYIKSLRGNAVLRWEYMPGSTLYFVWTQDRSDDEYDSHFGFGRSLRKLWNADVNNIFMIKVNYWWSL